MDSNDILYYFNVFDIESGKFIKNDVVTIGIPEMYKQMASEDFLKLCYEELDVHREMLIKQISNYRKQYELDSAGRVHWYNDKSDDDFHKMFY